VHTIRRSREVGQSFVSSVWTTAIALVDAARLVASTRPQLLLCNGPGTCLPLVAAAVALRATGGAHRACGTVYVESVARVQHLSLTGRLLYSLRLADAFFVQWAALVKTHPRAVCTGRLM
jgi:beta-1,4-N-acetylglucosaminyltransferase